MPKSSNTISSHCVLNIKDIDDGSWKYKGLLVLHGHLDAEKNTVRKYFSSAYMSVIRITLLIASRIKFLVGSADIKGAFIQSGPIT